MASVKGCSDASSMTALVSPFEEHGQHDDAHRRRLAEAGGDA